MGDIKLLYANLEEQVVTESGKFLVKYLADFMVQNNWDLLNIREQARALYTSICMVENLEADTYPADTILIELYYGACVNELMPLAAFQEFMYELIV